VDAPVVTPRPAPTATITRLLRRPLLAGLVLLMAYAGLSLFNHPRGYLGTDTGGKVATLEVMGERGDFDPDVGYWAKELDPEGRVHGLYYTVKIGDRFINVTSLPVVLAAEPLWRLGGYRLALLLPMLGAVAAAFAARALARRLGPGDGWPAFWLVGLASPMVIYALDFWEHTIGVALMAWGVIALFDAVDRGPTWWRGTLAGLAFGAAFSMRTESAVYGVVAIGLACLVLLVGRRDLVGALVTGATAVVGMAGMVLANAALETAVMGATLRSGRAGGAASSGGAQLALRAKEALVTSLSPFPALDTQSYVLAVGLALALAYVVWGSAGRRDRSLVVAAAALVVFGYLYRLSGGLGFVPGLVATTPVAVAGLVLGWRDARSRLAVGMAVLPLPLVFLFQFPGGAAPQWAGRYILTTGLLLAAVGMARLDLVERWVRTLLIALSLAVTLFGVGWLAVRSHAVAAAADRLESRPEPILISPNGFVPREFGGSYGRKNWLSTGNAEDLRFAVDVVTRSSANSFALVDLDTEGDPPAFDGWTTVGSERVPFLGGADFKVTSYQRTAPVGAMAP
jgi:hypothetical protein